jgi:hypothetical protein
MNDTSKLGLIPRHAFTYVNLSIEVIEVRLSVDHATWLMRFCVSLPGHVMSGVQRRGVPPVECDCGSAKAFTAEYIRLLDRQTV